MKQLTASAIFNLFYVLVLEGFINLKNYVTKIESFVNVDHQALKSYTMKFKNYLVPFDESSLLIACIFI